jgi:hypothetical protein
VALSYSWAESTRQFVENCDEAARRAITLGAA